MRFWLLFLCLSFTNILFSQSVKELEYYLEKASTDLEKLQLRYQLAATYLDERNYEKAEAHATVAHQLAVSTGQVPAAGYSALILAKAYDGMGDKDRKKRSRYDSKSKSWLETALNAGKRQKDLRLIVDATNLLCEIESKDRDYRGAYRYAQESLQFIASNKELVDPNVQYEKIQLLQKQVDDLTRERDSLRWEIQNQ